MSTRTDSFDRSQSDSFIQSDVDARNRRRQLGQQQGKIVILHYTYGGQAHRAESDGYVNGYWQNPDAPLYRDDHPTGIAKWDADFAVYAEERRQWTTPNSEMITGICNVQVWIPYLAGWFTMPLVPWVRTDDIAGWPQIAVQNLENYPGEHLERLQAFTLEVVQPDEEIYALVLIRSDVGLEEPPYWELGASWLEWAQTMYRNRVGAPIRGWPLYGIQAFLVPDEGLGGWRRRAHEWLGYGNELLLNGRF